MPRSIPSRLERNVPEPFALPSSTPSGRTLSPDELRSWLDAHSRDIARRWHLEVRSRQEEMDPPVEELLEAFLRLLAGFLPCLQSNHREQAGLIFDEAAELYGHLGAVRGLAAGEAIEETQLLREVLLRFLYLHPPAKGRHALGLRELLQVSRSVDRLVTHAGIGHTDTLFFKFFQSHGVPDAPGSQVLEEVREQLDHIRRDLEGLHALVGSGSPDEAVAE
jgi:hypothetical protein